MKSLGHQWTLVALVMLVLVSACGPAPTAETEVAPTSVPPTSVEEPPSTEVPPASSEEGVPVKVAYLATSPLGDFGWYYNGYEALKRACAALPYCEIIGYSENVAEPEAEPYLRDYADKGANLIVAHSYGYWEPAIKVAKDYPNVVFVYPQGDKDKLAENVGTYYARAEETYYLAGLMAGMMTKNNKLGFVLPIQTPMVNNECWGFRQGVAASNSNAKISYVVTDSWYDPPKERESALALIDQGADFIAYDADSTAVVDAVGERGALVAGVFVDLAYVAPESVVMSMLWPWDGYFTDTINAVHNGNFEPSIDLRGIKEGGTDITPFGPMVPQNVKDAVLKARQDIIDGVLKVEYKEDVCLE